MTQTAPLLTIEQVADYFRTTPGALYTQRHKGANPGALGVKVGKRVLFHPDDIERFVAEASGTTPPERWEPTEPWSEGSYAVVETINGALTIDSRVVAWVRPKP